MLSFSFNIAAFKASAPRLTTPEQWQAWAAEKLDTAGLPEQKPELLFLPPMQRRRLSLPARLMFDAAWQLAEAHPPCPLVFASHDGEINRSFELWLGLLKDNEVSPTSFGLSVHNALTGQWSMLRADTSENTALSVQQDGLETALAEAYSLLQEGAKQVLVILADDPLHESYAVAAQRAPFPYALAMMIEAGSDYHLSLLPDHPLSDRHYHYWGALDWLCFMLSDRHQQQQHYRNHCWLWQKNT